MIKALLGDEVDEYGGYIAEVIYGANDGIITTFAVVAGVAGAALDPAIVLILGFANLLADGFSMGASNYLSQRSSQEYQAAQNDVQEIDRPPAFTAATTFAAFVLVGWTPMLPYLLGLVTEDVLAPGVVFPLSLGAAAVAFFGVGASRSIVTNRAWYRAGGEMLTVGMVAAAVAYVVGSALGGLA